MDNPHFYHRFYFIGGIKLDKIKLIQDLIDKTNNLTHGNEEELAALRKRSRMIIRKVCGESSTYFHNLCSISFHPNGLWSGTNTSTSYESWTKGKSQMLSLFKAIEEDITLENLTENASNEIKKDRIKFSNKIFIVHGRDEEMKQALARTVEKIDLKPIILHEQPNKGRTIIEKFEDYSDVNFAIVLLSPDDIAYPKDKPPEDKEFRARQNVIFELGFFVGKLGREHVFILYREEHNFKFPSDYLGICYTPYDNRGQWRFDLIGELKSCKYNIDANKLIEN